MSGQTQAEARAKLDELRRDLRLGTLPKAGHSTTVGDYMTQWIERHRTRVRPSTWASREVHVRCYLVPALGRLPLNRLSASDVERALDSFLQDGRPNRPRGGRARIAPLTVRHVRATLRRALADAVRDGLVGRNAAGDARPQYVPHAAIAYLDSGAVRQLLAHTADDAHGPLYAVAASTGLRLGELLGLSWGDVDTVAGTLTVRQSLTLGHDGGQLLAEPKSARARRTIPLPGSARNALARQQARQDAARLAAGSAWQDSRQLVFTDAVGRPLRREAVSYAFQRARQAAGVAKVRLHDLRHTAATLMLSEGVPLAVISEWLGHSGIAITAQHYAAVVPALRHEAASAMDRALGG